MSADIAGTGHVALWCLMMLNIICSLACILRETKASTVLCIDCQIQMPRMKGWWQQLGVIPLLCYSTKKYAEQMSTHLHLTGFTHCDFFVCVRFICLCFHCLVSHVYMYVVLL